MSAGLVATQRGTAWADARVAAHRDRYGHAVVERAGAREAELVWSALSAALAESFANAFLGGYWLARSRVDRPPRMVRLNPAPGDGPLASALLGRVTGLLATWLRAEVVTAHQTGWAAGSEAGRSSVGLPGLGGARGPR